MKLEVLHKAIEADPDPDRFEAWLLETALQAGAASGPVRAVCSDILFEWQATLNDPYYRDWLLAGPEEEPAEQQEGP